MSLELTILLILIAGVIGTGVGYFLRYIITVGKRGSIELEIKQLLLDAKEQATQIIEGAQSQAEETLKELRKELREKEEMAHKHQERLIEKEASLEKRTVELQSEADAIKKQIDEVAAIKQSLSEMYAREVEALEKVAHLSTEEAKAQLLSRLEREYEEDLLSRLKKLEFVGKEKLEKRAQEIITTAIHRYGNSVGSDVMTTAVTIPNDDIKGKIIGKEGRNIKAFERATGVEVIIDDTPGTIIISSFDPVRRQVARIALENLMLDGRIQPARIEEFVEKARDEINRIIKEKGEQAAYEVGVLNLDPRILLILGRLYFRTSYGQNVLQHSVEMAHIAGMLAQELGADVAIAKAGALVHDIGKAVDHEVQGTHVEIGRRILQKFGADERIIKAMQAHHEEYPYETIESVIVQVADAISGSRPGARRDSVENYLKRLTELENLTRSFEGVEKVYAIQAGREVRVFVEPEKVSDLQAKQLARDIATKIEKELKYPGEIKIAVIRESRVVEYAR